MADGSTADTGKKSVVDRSSFTSEKKSIFNVLRETAALAKTFFLPPVALRQGFASYASYFFPIHQGRGRGGGLEERKGREGEGGKTLRRLRGTGKCLIRERKKRQEQSKNVLSHSH